MKLIKEKYNKKLFTFDTQNSFTIKEAEDSLLHYRQIVKTLEDTFSIFNLKEEFNDEFIRSSVTSYIYYKKICVYLYGAIKAYYDTISYYNTLTPKHFYHLFPIQSEVRDINTPCINYHNIDVIDQDDNQDFSVLNPLEVFILDLQTYIKRIPLDQNIECSETLEYISSAYTKYVHEVDLSREENKILLSSINKYNKLTKRTNHIAYINRLNKRFLEIKNILESDITEFTNNIRIKYPDFYDGNYRVEGAI